MINNERQRPITAYERDILEYVRTKFKEALEQRIKNLQKQMNDMNPARKAFEDELHDIIAAARCGATIITAKTADRLIELARRVINEE